MLLHKNFSQFGFNPHNGSNETETKWKQHNYIFQTLNNSVQIKKIIHTHKHTHTHTHIYTPISIVRIVGEIFKNGCFTCSGFYFYYVSIFARAYIIYVCLYLYVFVTMGLRILVYVRDNGRLSGNRNQQRYIHMCMLSFYLALSIHLFLSLSLIPSLHLYNT